jgi:gliding motility-associated-like protein
MRVDFALSYLLIISLLIIAFLPFNTLAQRIVDPCFVSIEPLGKFLGSEDVVNVCLACEDPYDAADMIEWNGTAWEGSLPHNEIFLPPPAGCSTRAVWMGYQFWTTGGEGIALRLDSGLVPGKQYQYTFTYASVGGASDNNFSPKLYTNSTSDLPTANFIGRLPGTDGWITNTLTFIAADSQSGHTWLFVHAFESSGIVLSQCDLTELYPPELKFLGDDKPLCGGETLELVPPVNANYQYTWSDNSQNPILTVSSTGEYSVKIQYGGCAASDTVTVMSENCEVILIMPNVFTPNHDAYNERFIPKEYNFISKGTTRIYNRWGNEIFTGNLFEGWDGKVGSSDASPGIYYYNVDFTDERQKKYFRRGYVTLLL